MSTSGHTAAPGFARLSVRFFSALVYAFVLATPVLAQDAPSGADTPGEEPGDGSTIDDWALAIAEATTPRWVGPRVPWQAPSPRPVSAGPAARSSLRPLAVHADPGVSPETVVRALEALESAHLWLEESEWGTPYPDGGLGATDGFDLYLRAGGVELVAPSFDRTAPVDGEIDEVPARAIRVGFDAPVAWSHLDAVTSFAELDARVPSDALEPCVVSAYAQALLAQLDPAEAPAWRRAIGTFLAWTITGSLGCSEDALELAQQHPERALVGHAPGSGEAGAMLLGAISARHDGGSGDFVRDLWHASRQWTWDGDGLRAEPDLWHAIDHFLEVSGNPLSRIVEDVAIGRWFTGSRSGLGARAIPVLRIVPSGVPANASVEWSRLPRTPLHGEPELAPHGSAYTLCDVRAAPAWSVLNVWLRGEFGVEWSLVAVRLDAEGRELGRMRAPVRREPRAFLPVELGEGTASVLLVVTNQSPTRPDADVPDDRVRGFRLVLARAGEAR